MNILFDINHPADVHFFRYTIEELRRMGHRILVTARDKDVALPLMRQFGIHFALLSKAQKGLIRLGAELIVRNVKLARLYRRENIHLGVAFTGTSVAQVGRLLGVPSLVFYDNEEAKLQNMLTYPFATRIYTPQCYQQQLGKKHRRFAGIKELAYLHPDRFKPDPARITALGVNPRQPYTVVRTVGWTAAHDIGARGIAKQTLRQLLRELKPHSALYFISEAPVEAEFEPFRLNIPPASAHHLLYFARLFIGEGATMACESACVGTPAIYVNTLKPSHVTLMQRAGLIFHLIDGDAVVRKAKAVLLTTDKQYWQGLAQSYIAHNPELTACIVQEIANFASSRERRPS